MASAKDDIFLKVEAVLSNDWVKSSGRDVTAILEEVENLGVEGINFHHGKYVMTGSLDQLLRIREHFLGKEKQSLSKKSEKETAVDSDKLSDYSECWSEKRRNDLSRKGLFTETIKREELKEVDADWVVPSKQGPLNSRKEEEKEKPSGNEHKDQQVSKELMVDNDIWDYIENKKNEELKRLEAVFDATVTKAEDDSGVLKISINPKSQDSISDDVSLMHETLVGLYQETFLQCVIEKHEVHFSDEEAELVLEYISEKFPDVFAKRCQYNDDFLFIGQPRLAREARMQFQVLAQRLKRGQLKARMNERLWPDDYDRSRRRRGSYEDRYDEHEYPYEGTSYRYTNDFNNASNEDLAVEKNHKEPFTGDEDRVISSVDDTTGGDLSNEICNEEKEKEEEKQKPQMNFSTDLPDVDLNRHDENKHLKRMDEVKKQSGSSSIIYWRPDTEETGAAKRCNSDVENDDWKLDFSDTNLGSKKGQEVDELKQELPESTFETSCKTKGNPEFSQNASETTWYTSSMCDDSRNKSRKEETEIESEKAAKQLEDVSDRKEGQTPDDDQVLKKSPHTARIDANSITYRSVDPNISQAQEAVAKKNFEEAFNSSFDDITGSCETLEKKPKNTKKKKAFDSGPKVKIIKQKVPMFPEPGDDAASIQTEVASGVKVVNESKAVSEESNSDLVVGKMSTSRAVKSSRAEVLGEPCRRVSDLEMLELKEVFKIQRKNLPKMRYDSLSSEDDEDAEDRVNKRAAKKHGRKEYKDARVTDEMIEELIQRGDEESQKLVQSLLDRATSGKELTVDDNKVQNHMAGEVGPGGSKLNVDVLAGAAEKPSVSRDRRAKAKIYKTSPQPPDGTIGCVIDKAFHLEGHDKSGTIEINISFEPGTQTDDQLGAERPYKGMTMKAFLPASGDGRETLRLMKAAFTARKLFALEQNDDDDDDVIVPNGVIFKDSPDLYPDPGYLPTVMEQLRNLTENQDN